MGRSHFLFCQYLCDITNVRLGKISFKRSNIKYYSSNKQAILGININSGKIWAYNNPIILIESIALFLYFHSLKINNKYISKIILKIAPLTFGVYLIHEQSVLRTVLYKNILHTEICYHNPYGCLILIASVLLIFSICIGIEYVRKCSLAFIKKRKKMS